jgi:hypothetical protein
MRFIVSNISSVTLSDLVVTVSDDSRPRRLFSVRVLGDGNFDGSHL